MVPTVASGRRTRRAMWVALAVLGLVALGDAGYGAAVLLTRDPPPRPLSGDRIFHASRPAVVLVQGEYGVKASLPEADLSSAKQTELTNQLLAMVRSGKLPLDENRINQAAFDLIAGSPDSYLTPSTSKRVDDSFDLFNSGTGFFVTEDGYLITASHVVSATKDDLKAELVDLAKEPANAAKNRDDLRASISSGAGFTVTDAQLDRLATWYQGYEEKYISLDDVSAKYFLASGASVDAGDHVTATGTRATLVAAEPAYPERDVALLKADVGAVPALRLAAGDPGLHDPDYVVGYPRKGYLQEAAPFNASVPVVLTSGKVETRIDHSDWTAFGTNASVTHGNSGGPVLDGKGDVLGVISFGADPGGSGPAQNYFVPSVVVKKLLDKAHVKPRPGTATQAYYRALQQGDLQHYKRELPLLQSLASRMPANTYFKEDVTTVQSAALGGQDRTPPDLTPYWPAAAGASGGALALVLLVMAITRLTSRREAVEVPTAAGTGQVLPVQAQVHLSPDGRWWWDGQSWQPVNDPGPPVRP